MCAGIGTLADSLFAVKRLVFEEKRCTLPELAAVLRSDWAGHEELRLYAKMRLPKWGNNLEGPDGLARRVTDFAAELINREPNGKKGTFQMGLWSIDNNRLFGKKTGALPDGSRAGEELSKNTGASGRAGSARGDRADPFGRQNSTIPVLRMGRCSTSRCIRVRCRGRTARN